MHIRIVCIIYVKRDLQKRPIYVKRDLQKRPVYILHSHCVHSGIHAAVKAWSCHTDICRKRPVYVKRDLQKRPVYILHSHYMHSVMNAAVNTSSCHTDICQKRPTTDPCVQPAFALYAFCHKCCGKRDLYMSKETCKRDLCTTCIRIICILS